MMKSKIVVSNNISESEKLKSLAYFNESTFDVRYLSSYYLAEYLLQLSGITYKKTFIKNDLLSAFLYKKIKEIDYFSKFSYNDILNLVETIEDVRYHIIENEDDQIELGLTSSHFLKKNLTIKEAYRIIKEFLSSNNYIDEVGVIRFALANINTQLNLDIIKYEKSHLRPLEEYLIDFASGHKVSETKICESDKSINIVRYTKSFGQSNEIEDILSYIYENNISFDDCVIASTSGENYANILNNYKDLLGFPLTIGVGKRVTETNPGKLFSLIVEWEKNLFHKDYLCSIFNSESFSLSLFKEDIGFLEDLTELNKGLSIKDQISFESFINLVGDLRLSFSKEINDQKLTKYENLVARYELEKDKDSETIIRERTLPLLKRVIEIFNKGESNFLERYSLIEESASDSNALGKIIKLLSFEQYGVNKQDIVNQVIGQKVAKVSPIEGTIYLTSISNARSCLRKYLFIVGLSSNNFPGKNVENPIMLNEDYIAFKEKDNSSRKIRDNKDDYFALLEEAKKYDVNIYLSWPIYNEETLKNQNSSSVVFETYKLERNENSVTINDFENEFKKDPNKYRYVEYFQGDLTPINSIGRILNHGDEVLYHPLEEDKDENVYTPVSELIDSNHAFSASSVTNFAKCPYMFYLINVLGLQSKKDIDLLEVIPSNDSGSLAHELLEHLNKKETSREEFLKISENRFNDYLIFHPAESNSLAELAKKEFIDMMGIAYDMESQLPVEVAEKDFYCLHKESGIKIHGLPDKIFKVSDNHYLIVDYKTGKKVKHFVDDVASMIQCTLYSYVYEHYKKNAKVDGFEYSYIKTGDRVKSSYFGYTMNDHYNNLTSTLISLRAAIQTGNFEPNIDNCSQCYVKDYCRKKK